MAVNSHLLGNCISILRKVHATHLIFSPKREHGFALTPGQLIFKHAIRKFFLFKKAEFLKFGQFIFLWSNGKNETYFKLFFYQGSMVI